MLVDKYQRELFPHLIAGRREQAKLLFQRALEEGITAEFFLAQVCWPILDQIESLWRDDRIESLAYRYSTRTMRRVIDDASRHLQISDQVFGEMLVFCGPTESSDLGGQLISDLAESCGWEVCFAGGGVASDEILQEVQKRKPKVLLLFASAASEAPHHKRVVDSIRENGACPETSIAVCGGIFSRVPELACEIGIDICESDPQSLLQAINAASSSVSFENTIAGAA